MKCFHLILFIGLIGSCKSQKLDETTGVLKGTIGIFEGNCMPAPGEEPCKPKPIETTIYITQLAEAFDSTLVVDSTASGRDGSYELRLPAGKYSLFLKDGKQVACDRMECNPNCYCLPFEINPKTVTIVDANIDHAAW